MSDRFMRVYLEAALQAVVGTAPSPVQVDRAMVEGRRATSSFCGGETVRIYVGKRVQHDLSRRDRDVRAQFAAGVPIGALAARYGLSERQVQRIVSCARATPSD